MESSASPKPVMDVTAPKQPAAVPAPDANASLAVHQAPPRTDAAPETADTSAPASDTTDSKSAPKEPPSKKNKKPETPADTPAPKATTPPKPKDPNPAPVGAITGAIIVMILLSAAAIAVYLKG
jgi:hypothetical protein